MKFKNSFLLSLSFLFTALSAKAQHSLLWEITGDNLANPSYLFGTMHVKDKRAFQFHDSLMTKLKSCKVFAGEIVLDKNAAKEVSADLLLPPGKELKTLLTEREYKKVKKFCRKHLGAMSLFVNKIKPVFTSAMISESLMGSEMPKALDEYLQDKAKAYDLRVTGLETIQEQMSALDELSIEDQAKMLVEQIEHLDDEKKELQKLANVYASQNLDSIYSFVQTPEMQGEFGDALIKDRNLVMADRLEKLIIKDPTFCAIGAAHLPGANGVLNLLKQKGYTLRAIVK
ncbi:MAG TPA: TraB/GumN family protein [Cytophagaceae bacterium]|nr:TraB/GumN family protein [Cytophagaceae bacterium]